MNITILGTGAVGLGYAAYLSAHNHEVTVWSPTGRCTDAFESNGNFVYAEGKLEGCFKVDFCRSLTDAMASAEVVIFALPAYAHEKVMREAAPLVREAQLLVVTPVYSLSAYFLAKLIEAAGIRALVCASPTTVLTARRLDNTRVQILSVRLQVDLSCFPSSGIDQAMTVMESLFGNVFSRQRDLLVSSLSNVGSICHVPLVLMNMTRVERKERWFQYEHFSANVSRLIETMDSERLAVGKALGVSLGSVTDHFCRSFGTTPASLADVAAQIVRIRDGGPAGPTSTETRYLTEDVPFGLAFYSYIGKIVEISTPMIDACIALACASMGRDFPKENGFLHELSRSVKGNDIFLSEMIPSDCLAKYARPLIAEI